jgi:hypothetical protein
MRLELLLSLGLKQRLLQSLDDLSLIGGLDNGNLIPLVLSHQGSIRCQTPPSCVRSSAWDGLMRCAVAAGAWRKEDHRPGSSSQMRDKVVIVGTRDEFNTPKKRRHNLRCSVCHLGIAAPGENALRRKIHRRAVASAADNLSHHSILR